MKSDLFEKLERLGRRFETSIPDAELLGPLKDLPGTWKSEGFGWNLIALPFRDGVGREPFQYRVLMNQYNETLRFTTVGTRIPNRGIASREFPDGVDALGKPSEQNDQFITSLDYEQSIEQIAADDFPKSGLAGAAGDAIHHEPGLFLNMLNKKTDCLDIARLATVPHGDSVLALGKSEEVYKAVEIPVADAFPIRVPKDEENPYLEPYFHYVKNPFKGVVTEEGFPGFSPDDANKLLRLANRDVTVKRTVVLPMDTTVENAGIVNIPFVVKQANAAEMKATFWIQELDKLDANGDPVLRLQYSQNVLLDFFPSPGGEGPIRWPHISINTLTKVPEPKYGKKA